MQQMTKVGQGFDAHRFIASSAHPCHIRLCGVDIEHDQAIDAHSDGDVALHALSDALLGAVADHDIGHYFPPESPKFKAMDSCDILKKACERVHAHKGRVIHVDMTIICEKPKITPHRHTMRKRLADLLQLPLSSVSVKATTTEMLGFTGRREGIAVLATASILVPYEEIS